MLRQTACSMAHNGRLPAAWHVRACPQHAPHPLLCSAPARAGRFSRAAAGAPLAFGSSFLGTSAPGRRGRGCMAGCGQLAEGKGSCTAGARSQDLAKQLKRMALAPKCALILRNNKTHQTNCIPTCMGGLANHQSSSDAMRPRGGVPRLLSVRFVPSPPSAKPTSRCRGEVSDAVWLVRRVALLCAPQPPLV